MQSEDERRRYHITKIARNNGLMLPCALLLLLIAWVSVSPFWIYGPIGCLALFSLVFILSSLSIFKHIKRGLGLAIDLQDILTSRLYRYYIWSASLFIFLVVAVTSSSFSYAALIIVMTMAIYVGRYAYVAHRRNRLPTLDPKREFLVKNVERTSGITGITLRVDPKRFSASVMLVSWRRPLVIASSLAVNGLSDQQLESVLIHEMGHFVHKDVLKLSLFIYSDLGFASFLVMAEFAIRLNFLFIFPVLLFFLFFVFTQPWIVARLSQRNEYKADEYCASFGFGDDLVSALRTLRSINGMPLRFPEGLLMSHPDLEARAKRIARYKTH